METSINEKAVELNYNTFLTLINTFLVGLIGLWIVIFVQPNLSLRYKLIISGTIINLIILTISVLIALKNRAIRKLINLGLKNNL